MLQIMFTSLAAATLMSCDYEWGTEGRAAAWAEGGLEGWVGLPREAYGWSSPAVVSDCGHGDGGAGAVRPSPSPATRAHRPQDLSSAASCQMPTPPSQRCSGRVFQSISLSLSPVPRATPGKSSLGRKQQKRGWARGK